jgi:hypothetical protein
MNELYQVTRRSRVNSLQYSFITLPALYISVGEWTGVSAFQKVAALNNTTSIGLTPFAEPPNTSCIITVSYPVGVNKSVRYKLWEDVGEVIMCPLYTGQLIGPGAYFELWSVEDSSVIALADLLIETSLVYSALLNSCCGMSSSSSTTNCNCTWPTFPPGSSTVITPSGNMYVLTPDDGLYHRISAVGPDGSAVMTMDPYGVSDPV